jgi:hypothetical protein
MAYNGLGLADVPALAFRLFGKLGKVDKRTNDRGFYVSRYIGKPVLAVRSWDQSAIFSNN